MTGSPSGWASTTIGEIADYVQRGRGPTYAPRSTFPVVNQKCIRWDGVDPEHLKFIDESTRSQWALERHLKRGDVLWNSTGTGTLGRAAVFEGLPGFESAVVDSHVTIVRSTKIEPRFIYYWIRGPAVQGRLEEMQAGSTNQVELPRSEVIATKLPLPPLNEQRRIIAKLDAIFEQTRAAKARLNRLPALLDKLKRSILAAACAARRSNESGADEIPSTWRWVTLQDLVATGGIFDGARDHGSGTAVAQNLRTADYTESGVRVIRLENLAHLTFIEEKRTFISEEKFIGLKQNEVREGDLLFGSFIDEQVRVCRLPRLGVPAIAKADCFCVRPDLEKVLPEYLLLQLACQRTRDSIESQAHGLGRLRITTKQLRAIRVPLCSMSEQQQIVDKVTSQFFLADQMLRRVQTGIQRIDEVERAALAKAFRGELVKQDPIDEPASALLERIRALVDMGTEEGAAKPRGRVARAKSQGRTALAETES